LFQRSTKSNALPATLTGLGEYLNRWGIDYRVLVVDDGSRDRTAGLDAKLRPPVFDDLAAQYR